MLYVSIPAALGEDFKQICLKCYKELYQSFKKQAYQGLKRLTGQSDTPRAAAVCGRR